MITSGKHTYGHVTPRGVSNDVIIGDYCSIAEGVLVDCGFGHRTDFIATWPFDVFWHGITGRNTGTTKGNIVIGNDVWLGERVVIMSGVTIGDGAVIGIQSIVTKDIPPYAIAAGAPAVVKRFRFPPEIIARLLKAKWWDWPEEKVREHSRLLVSNDFEAFFKVAGV